MPATPTVSTWPQNISAGPGARPSSTPTTFGRPGSTSTMSTMRPALDALGGDAPRDLPFAAGAGDERRIHRVDGDKVFEQPDGRIGR